MKHSEVGFKTLSHGRARRKTPTPEAAWRGAIRVDPSAPVRREGSGPATASAPSEAPVTASAPTRSGFAALGDNNTSIPPDTNGAAGPNHLMVAANSQVKIMTKTGAAISTVTLNSFFASLGNPEVFDPHISYDPFNGRWIFVATANALLADSGVLLAISDNADPTGTWHMWILDADATDSDWADYPTLGFNKKWITINFNMFPIGGQFADFGVVWAFNKASLYAGAPSPSYMEFSNPNLLTVVPAVTYDNSTEDLYLAQSVVGNNPSDSLGYVATYKIAGNIGAEVLSGPVYASTTQAWASDSVAGAPQSGSIHDIDVRDDRVQNVAYRNGSVWFTHNVYLPASHPNRSSIQWWKIAASTGSVEARGRIDDPTAVKWYAFPSIAVNSAGDAMLGFSRFSGNQYPSANYALKPAANAQFGADTVLKAGEGPYYKTFGAGSNRWGDYSNTVVDPNDLDFWTIQEYAAPASSGYDRWATYWGHLTFAPELRFSVGTVSSTEGVASVTLTVTRTGDASAAVGVHYATSDGTASAGTDYVNTVGDLSFASGETSKSFALSLLDDGTLEDMETFTVTLSAPIGGVALGNPATATVSIIDNETGPTAGFASGAASTRENGSALLTVVRSGDTTTTETVSWTATPGTATLADLAATRSGTVAFAAEQTTATFLVPVNNDSTQEGPETFTVVLSAPTVGTIGTSTATVTILTSDQRVDVLERASGSPTWYGSNYYSSSNGTLTSSARRGAKAVFYFMIQNDGNQTNAFTVKSSKIQSGASLRLYYNTSSTNITSKMFSGTYPTGNLPVGKFKILRGEVTISSTASIGSYKYFYVTGYWKGDVTALDGVRARVKVIR